LLALTVAFDGDEVLVQLVLYEKVIFNLRVKAVDLVLLACNQLVLSLVDFDHLLHLQLEESLLVGVTLSQRMALLVGHVQN
jgi:hypothetical protein